MIKETKYKLLFFSISFIIYVILLEGRRVFVGTVVCWLSADAYSIGMNTSYLEVMIPHNALSPWGQLVVFLAMKKQLSSLNPQGTAVTAGMTTW